MVRLDLGGQWKFKDLENDEWLNGLVPGSVYNDLLNLGRMEDPFYRDNEDKALELSKKDYEYEREFIVTEDILKHDLVLLNCEGLDTIAEILINGKLLANTNNMHRTYKFDLADFLVVGKNSINVRLYSPVKYIEKKHEENPLWGIGSDMVLDGYPHLRKAHCMFGWDWGPKLPDLGIWRNIYITAFNYGKLEEVYVTQNHEEDKVNLDIKVGVNIFSLKEDIRLEVKLNSPSGEVLEEEISCGDGENHIELLVENPKLWWPNGYGEQALYKLKVEMLKGGQLLDSYQCNIGLRNLTVKQQKDQWGESFEFNINGISIFAMGADYIPEDNILPRCNKERTEKLIQDCIKANFNCIRVWGGGIYPEDYFFDLCDKYGLIVWQDLMFACAVYELTEDFTENIIKEVEDNMRRIRNHASLGLWCGNNEMEAGWVDWDFPKTPKTRLDYIKQFEFILPEVAKRIDPNTFYWRSSPSSGGGFDNPNDENRGDVHYWEVWHGQKPFTEYRKFFFRFASEFGFQSFPSLKTVESYTLPEDRNIFSYVMEKHQKNGSANGKILYYLAQNFKYPKDFDSLLYTSQLLQAEAIKYGVEHWRRNRGRCMGSVYWQLNDCWPVASWASIDSFGRWKALHYFARRFYAPVIITAEENSKGARLVVTNDTLSAVEGKVIWSVRDNSSNILLEGSQNIFVDKLSVVETNKIDLPEELTAGNALRKIYLEYSLMINGKKVSKGTVTFVPNKHFDFLKPEITFEVREGSHSFDLYINAKNYGRYVEVLVAGSDVVLSDNYFDISGGETVKIELPKKEVNLSLEAVRKAIKIRSLADAY